MLDRCGEIRVRSDEQWNAMWPDHSGPYAITENRNSDKLQFETLRRDLKLIEALVDVFQVPATAKSRLPIQC